jgi:hypothetical protein
MVVNDEIIYLTICNLRLLIVRIINDGIINCIICNCIKFLTVRFVNDGIIYLSNCIIVLEKNGNCCGILFSTRKIIAK